MRLIDGDALIDNMFHYAAPEMVWDRGDIEHKIGEMPTIDAEPVRHGRWVVSDTGLWQYCSECGVAVEVESMFMCKASENKNFLYCPTCGAKMDLEEIRDDRFDFTDYKLNVCTNMMS